MGIGKEKQVKLHWQKGSDPFDKLLAQKKCLLYMSVMRAMNNVLITSSHGVNSYVPSDQVLLI